MGAIQAAIAATPAFAFQTVTASPAAAASGTVVSVANNTRAMPRSQPVVVCLCMRLLLCGVGCKSLFGSRAQVLPDRSPPTFKGHHLRCWRNMTDPVARSLKENQRNR